MQKLILFILILSLFSCGAKTNRPIQVSVENNRDIVVASDSSCIIPDPNDFLLKNVKETLDRYDTTIMKRFKILTPLQEQSWTDRYGAQYAMENVLHYRAVSLQKTTDQYYLLLIMQCEDFMNQQFIVSVDKNGKYIDSLPVSYFLDPNNSDVEYDSIRNVYKATSDVKSYFLGDTIKMVCESLVFSSKDFEDDGKEAWYEYFYHVKDDGHIEPINSPNKVLE